MIASPRIASQQLREIVYGVDGHIEIAIVVEISERTAARGNGRRNSRPAFVGNVLESAVPKILIEKLSLRVARFRFELLDFGIDMAIADQNVGPSVVVHVEEAAPPAQILRVLAEARLVSGVLKSCAAETVVERRRVAGKICFDQVEIA